MLRRWLFGTGCALAFIASQNNCGFPSYGFTRPAAGGAGAAGSSGGAPAGAGGTGGTGGAGAVAGGLGGDGNSAGASGDAGTPSDAGASGGTPCAYLPPVTYAQHCFDNLTGDNETGRDCGGPDCPPCETNQLCTLDRDCAGGTCNPASTTCTQVVALKYMSIVGDAFTNGPKFRLSINYMDTKAMALSALRVRYYFNHNGVTEPVIARDIQATLGSGGSLMDISTRMSALVQRLPPGPPAQKGGQVTDSYLELTFSGPYQLAAGAVLDLTADILAGSTDTLFQQASHYSFTNVGALTPTDTITVFRGQQRVWGIEPPLSLLPACAYVRGVNLGGPTVVLGANAEGPALAQAAGAVTFSGALYSSPTPKPFPTTDVNTAKMLSSAFVFTSADTATWSVANGRYWLYAWLTSAASADSGVLSIQDTPLDKFFGLQQGAGAGWARLGPYPIEVTDGALRMSATGKVNVSGLALYQPEP